MSFHADVARKALLDGNTSEQFRQAAQKHANATWFYLIIAGIVWYFTNWAWAIIPFGLAAFMAFQSISATIVAKRIEFFEKKSSE